MLQTNMSDGKSDSEDPKRSGTVLVTPSSAEASEDGLGDRDAGADRGAAELAKMGSKRALIAWMILCYSTGPTSSVAISYVTAAIQSLANLLGHVPGHPGKACAKRGVIKCVVKFGGHDIDYNSYLIYINAIGRALQGVGTILFSGIADFSYYRKYLMLGAIILYGIIALPFAGFKDQSYSALIALSVLFVGLNTVQGVYLVTESSYVPIFMRSVGWFREPARIGGLDPVSPDEDARRTAKHVFTKGTRVSVLGLFAGNLGGLTGLLIGLVITYTRGSPLKTGYHNFLLAISISGSLTICFAILGGFLLPSIPGLKQPPGTNLALLPVKRWFRLLKSIRKYPEAFKLCIGWVLWYISFSNFISIISLLFREVSGLSSGDRLYTVYSFLNVIYACIGSLTWMFVFPYFNFPIKRWAYGFLSIQFLCVFWGTIGIANIPVGYKHTAEFWVQQAIYLASVSALRAINRVMFASMLPKGAEAQFFGLEVTLDLATGWINTLVQGVIQNRTHNLRFPLLPDLLVILVSIGFYLWFDLEKGIEDAKKPLDEDDE
ncbi:autophagy-related protein 22-like protein [Halenospora varia]|nr:autophagy-related protein 22-like protein [Halenospora varia]